MKSTQKHEKEGDRNNDDDDETPPECATKDFRQTESLISKQDAKQDAKHEESKREITKQTDTNSVGAVLVGAKQFYIPPSKPVFIVAHPNPTSQHMLQHGIFEKELIQWVKQFLKPNEDMLDIGAHCGTYSLSLAPHCRNVYAFEAQRMTYFQLCGGIALNYAENVWPRHLALGSKKGKMTLHITSNDGGGSTLNKTWTEKQRQHCLRTEICETKTLDSFEFGFGTGESAKVKICFIKIDVEGHELEVLKGAQQTIKANQRPIILFEVWNEAWYENTKSELFRFILETLRYRAIVQAPYAHNMFIARD